MICGVWMLCLHDRYHPVYPATHHRQIWHHDGTTVHFPPLYLYNFLLPLVRLPARVTEKSRAWPPSHSRLETIKSTPETPILCRRLFEIPQRRLPRFLRFESEIRLPGRVAVKTVCQCLWPKCPILFQPPANNSSIYFTSLLSFRFPPPLSQNWLVFVEEPSEGSSLPCKCRRQRPAAINTSALSKWKPWIIQSNSDNKKRLLYKLFKHFDGSSRHAFESRSRQAEMHSDKHRHNKTNIPGMRRETGD